MTYDPAQLKKELERDEGRRLEPYKDTEGIWSIGIGHNLEAKGIPFEILIELLKKHGLTDSQVDRIFKEDIGDAARDLDVLWPWWNEQTDNRQRALLNMCFNLGLKRLRGFRNMWGSIKSLKWKEAKYHSLDSKWAKQVGSRSTRIAEMLENT